MFDKLKKAFSSAAKGIGQKEITEKVLDNTLFDLQMSLLESDVAQEAVDALSAKLKKELLGLRLEKGEDPGKIIQSKLQNTVAEVFARAGKFELEENIRKKKETRSGPFVIVFLGINGTGKTTTVAKIGNILRKSGFTVVIAAGDTHRAGAIEQLTQHANRLSLKVVAQRYGADPSAVGRDAVEHARKNHIDVVLVDTAGRMQTSKNLMDEMAKIVRVVKPDAKLFIGDALAGNDTINQAREFFQYTNFDGAILTKIDADAKGGAAISIAHITSRPIVFVGIGQGYNDIIPFEPDKFIESLFGSAAEVKVEDLMSMPRPAEPAVETIVEQPTIEPEPEEKVLEAEKEKPMPVSASLSDIASEERVEPSAEEPVPSSILREPETVKDERPEQIPPPAPAKPEVTETAQEPEKLPSKQPEVEGLPELDEAKEKKARFGGLFRKKSDEQRRKEEQEKREAAEKREKEEEERASAEDEERRKREKEKEEKKKKRKEDKDTEEDKIVYLTDEDIEDLLK